MDAQAAARLGDEIAHGFGVAAMVAGAVAGALIGAAVVAATVATGGVALAIMAGSVAAGGLSMFQIVKGLGAIFKLPEPTTGALVVGSINVYINSRNAMRAGMDNASSCTGFPCNHPLWPFPVLIAEGSASVFINGAPAARLKSKMVCGAHIKSGSENTFIGGPTLRVAFVLDIEGWMHTGLEALGLLAAGGALILAAMAGAAVLAGAVAIGAAMMGGMALLGDLGDRLGPGYRDLLQGVAGMALLGLGPKLARLGNNKSDANTVKGLGKVEGSYSAMEPGPLPDSMAGTFSGGRYKVVVLENDTLMHRAGTVDQPLGQFFDLEPPQGILQARIDKAVLPEWPGGAKSPIDTSFEIKIPAGTKVYVGEVGSQGGVYVGGTQQVIVQKPWLIEGVEVIGTRPLQ